MIDSPTAGVPQDVSRRHFMQWLVAAGLAVPVVGALDGCTGGSHGGQTRPTAVGTQRPPTASKPDKLVYVAKTLEPPDIPVMQPALASFTQEEGPRVDLLQYGDADYIQRALAYFAAGSQMDATFIGEAFFGQWAQQEVIQPIDGLPGVDRYVQDATAISRGAMQSGGHTWGLPVSAGDVMLICYHDGNFKKAGLTNPPTTWDELVQQCEQAQGAGFSHPIVWAAGQGDSHLPWQWYCQVHSRDGGIFTADGKPDMGPGSVARDTLSWWRDTFQVSQISDPQSAQLRYVAHAKAFETGKYVFAGLTMYEYLQPLTTPPSPLAGQLKIFPMPGNGKTMGYQRTIAMSKSTVSAPWTWELMQYVGGKDLHGNYSTPKRQAMQGGYIPAYTALLDDPDVAQAWQKYFDFEAVKRTLANAVHYSAVVNTVYTSWFAKWQDTVNVQLQNCILGKTSADSACDAMAAAAVQLSKTS